MFSDIQLRLQAAALRAVRPMPKLIAVSKTQPDARVADVLEQGHRIYGENKVQEAIAKWPGFRGQYGAVELHLLGPLQTNKVNQILPHIDYLHSLDRPKLADKLAAARGNGAKLPQCLIQVNIGNEAQKSGVAPEDTKGFVAYCRAVALPIIGLMCIPPADVDPRPYFRRLADLARENQLAELSMGMSGDFEIAVEEGATMVRVGSAIFGARDY